MVELLHRSLRAGLRITKTEGVARTLRNYCRKNWIEVSGAKCAIVTVNYNTARLISHLLFSLFRILDRKFVARIVVVDNGSTDNSLPILRELRCARLIDLIENRRQRYHGPGLNQGINYLRKIAKRLQSPADGIGYILVLDSDTVVLRHDLLDKSVAALESHQAALAGQFRVLDNFSYAQIYCMLFKPHLVWVRGIAPFGRGGIPALAMQESIERAGLKRLDFPFTNQAFLVHLGEGTLRAIYQQEDKANNFYEWSTIHHEHHYSGCGKNLYEEFLTVFNKEVRDLTPESLLEACIKPELLRLELPWKVEVDPIRATSRATR
jgi:glycosyltransferase involved in cell wall biosynthesis